MSFFEFPHTRTYDSDLAWLIKQVRTNQEAIQTLEDWKASVSSDINDLQTVIAAIRAGELPADIAEGIKEWIAENFYDIVSKMIQTVWFGLTDDGYFVAYVPESWRDVVFKTTGLDIDIPLQPEYGHLVLQANYYTHSVSIP